MLDFSFPFEETELKPESEIPILALPERILLPGEPLSIQAVEEPVQRVIDRALAKEKLLILRPGGKEPSSLCTLGRIAMDEVLASGAYQAVLIGLKRAQVTQVVRRRPVEEGWVRLVPDAVAAEFSNALSGLSEDLSALGRDFLARAERADALPEPVADILQGALDTVDLPLGMLADLLGAGLALSPAEKQMLLNETDVVRRAERIRFHLQFELRAAEFGLRTPPLTLH